MFWIRIEVAEEESPVQAAATEEREQPKRKVSFEDGTAQVFDSAVAPEKIHDGPVEEAPIPPETPVPEEDQKEDENQGKGLISDFYASTCDF